MAHDDVAAERERLEAVAWGSGSSPADAARARVTLQDLDSGRRSRVLGASGGRGGRTGGPDHVGTSAPSPTGSGSEHGAAPAGTAPRGGADGGARRTEDGVGGTPPSRAGTTVEHDAGHTADAADAADGDTGDHAGAVSGDDGRAPGLPAEPTRPSRWRMLLWTRRPRAWAVAGAVAAVGVAFAVGTVVGTARPDVAAAPSITPTAGTVTLEQLLDAPQTYADQLPGPVAAPVSLHTTRIVFSNRALDGGTAETPWNVWAGVGTDRSTICLVATADRIESSSACFPRDAALHGSVSMSAQSRSGTLTIDLRGGGVQGRVTNGY